jgi:hypothetical protein
MLGKRERERMDKSVAHVNVPEDWVGQTVLVLSPTTGETLLTGGFSLVGDIYSGELRAVNSRGISLMLSSREKEEGAYYPGGDTFIPWTAVLRITLASQ